LELMFGSFFTHFFIGKFRRALETKT